MYIKLIQYIAEPTVTAQLTFLIFKSYSTASTSLKSLSTPTLTDPKSECVCTGCEQAEHCRKCQFTVRLQADSYMAAIEYSVLVDADILYCASELNKCN